MNKKNILEGCTTNIICVKNNKLYLPKAKCYFWHHSSIYHALY